MEQTDDCPHFQIIAFEVSSLVVDWLQITPCYRFFNFAESHCTPDHHWFYLFTFVTPVSWMDLTCLHNQWEFSRIIVEWYCILLSTVVVDPVLNSFWRSYDSWAAFSSSLQIHGTTKAKFSWGGSSYGRCPGVGRGRECVSFREVDEAFQWKTRSWVLSLCWILYWV